MADTDNQETPKPLPVIQADDDPDNADWLRTSASRRAAKQQKQQKPAPPKPLQSSK